MSDNSSNNRRLAKNTIFLYARMMFSMLVSLYTTRLILNTLGEVDFGLYNAVGGFVVIFAVISGSLSSSVSRFLTFELGRKDQERLSSVFTSSLIIHFVLSILMILVLETFGLWFLNHQLNIPEGRLSASNWVFQCSVLSFVIGIIGVPYGALITAHERMDVYAYIGIAQVMLHLAAVLYLAFGVYDIDKLIVYGLLNVLISVSLQIYQWWYCRSNFAEAHFVSRYDRSLFKHIGAFAGWNFIGSLAGMLKDQGVNILLNIFGGPVVNTARGIGGSLNGAVTKFSGSFMTALNPQIIKSYASGDKDYLFSLVQKGSRFSFYAMFIFALPVFIEADTLLTLWLGAFPIHTVNFARLFIILTMIDILSSTLITLQSATGKIKNYQIVVGGALLLNFPLSYLALSLGASPESTMIVAIGVAILCLILRLTFLKNMVGLPFWGYMKNVVLNVVLVAMTSLVLPAVLFYLMQDVDAYWRLAVTIISSLLSTSLATLYIGCSATERHLILSKTKELLRKVFRHE